MKYYVSSNKRLYACDPNTSLEFVYNSSKQKWVLLPYSLNNLTTDAGHEITESEASCISNISQLNDLLKMIKKI